MSEGIYFADAELPFHVWVRQRNAGNDGFRWVLRETRSAAHAPADGDAQSAPDGTTGPDDAEPAR